MQKPEQTHVVIDGKAYPITKCPPAPTDGNGTFDRCQFDTAGMSPDLDRYTVLAHKNFKQPIWADGRRTGAKPQAE